MNEVIRNLIITYDNKTNKFVEAVATYMDSGSRNISVYTVEEATELLRQVSMQNGNKTKEELKANKIVFEEWKDFNMSATNNDNETLLTPVKPKIRKLNMFSAGVSLLALGVVLAYSWPTIEEHFKSTTSVTPPSSPSSNSAEIDFDSLDEIIASLKAGAKKEVVGKAYQFLKESNKSGGHYKFQSIVDYIVLSHSYSGEELYNVFDNYDPDFNKIREFSVKEMDGKGITKELANIENTYSQQFVLDTLDYLIQEGDKTSAIQSLKILTSNTYVNDSINILYNIANTTTDHTNELNNLKAITENGIADLNTKIIDRALLVAITQAASQIAQNNAVFNKSFYDKYNLLDICGSLIFDTGQVSGMLKSSQTAAKESITNPEPLYELVTHYDQLLRLASQEEKIHVIYKNIPQGVVVNKNPSNGGSYTTKKEIKEEDLDELPEKVQDKIEDKKNELDEKIANFSDNLRERGKEIGLSNEEIYTTAQLQFFTTQISCSYDDFRNILDDIIDSQKEDLEDSNVNYTDGQIRTLMSSFKSGLRQGVERTIERAKKDAIENLKLAGIWIEQNADGTVPFPPESSSSVPEPTPTPPESLPELPQGGASYLPGIGDFIEEGTINTDPNAKSR